MTLNPEYACPLCAEALNKQDNSLACSNRHQFDYAKEGYVHLLPVQLKKSLQPGDDKNMVMARREFLQLGHYQFLRDALLEEIKQLPHNNLIDLGCGEGYYTNFIETELTDSRVYGVDISKAAVKYAAKRNKQVHYCVATNAHIPFADNYSDLILNVFAPIVGDECKRVLNNNGCILSAAPGPKHLFELKQFIYDEVELHTAATVPEGFTLEKSEQFDNIITLTEIADVENLLTMTPFGWKITEQKKQILLDSLPLAITLSFTINQFKLI